MKIMNTIEIPKESTYAVVIGLGTNGLANVRALCQKGVPVIIFLSSEESEEVYAATRYGQKKRVDVKDGAAILKQLHALATDKTYLLYPTTDAQVQYLSQHRKELPVHCTLLFPEEQVIDMLLDKKSFDQFCHAHQFPVPATALVEKRADVQRACERMNFPILAKTPTKVYKKGLEKAYILPDEPALRDWYDSIQGIHQEFVLQEYIPGTDRTVLFTMQYIAPAGDLLASFTGRKIRQWPPLRGGTSSAEPLYHEELTTLTYNFFRKAGFWGMGSMEYKQDPRSGKCYLIEPTVGRTDFQEGVAIANGVNIPFIAYQNITGQAVQPVFQSKNARTAWMHVLYDRLAGDWYVERKELTRLEWLSSIRYVRAFDAFSFRDPGPAFRILREKIITRLKR